MAKLTEAQYKIIADRMVEERRKYGDYLRPGHWAEVAARKVASHMDDFREEVEPLEAISASLTEENAKLRDLLQELVNDMRRLRIEFGNRTGTTTQVGIASLESAKEQGFVPTNTQDNG